MMYIEFELTQNNQKAMQTIIKPIIYNRIKYIPL